MTKTYIYPVIITFDETEKSRYKYIAYIPDLHGHTQGDSIEDALEMANDYIEVYALVNELPMPDKLRIPHRENAVIRMLEINIEGSVLTSHH